MSRSKFFAKSVETDFGKFASLAEADRYLVLADMEERGLIHELTPHVSFEIIPKLTRLEEKRLKTKTKMIERVISSRAIYTCDATYIQDGVLVIEEDKSKITVNEPDYVLRKKLMLRLIDKWNKSFGYERYRFYERICEPPRRKRKEKKKKSKSDALIADTATQSSSTDSTLLYHYAW